MKPNRQEVRVAAIVALAAVAGMMMVHRASGMSDSLPVLVDPRASQLVSMEREFCSSVAQLGIRDGFLRYFAADGILFRPNPVVAVQYFPTRPTTPASLIWTAELADISTAGDLGYTFGPWELRPAGLEDTTFANGTYVTLWRREPDEAWKIVLDWGISHELEPSKAGLLGQAIATVRSELGSSRSDASLTEDVRAAASAITDLTRGSAELLEADRAFLATSDPASIANGCRFLRQDHPPLVGIEALRSAVGADVRPTNSTPDRAFVSRSGDLGYVYGSYPSSSPSKPAPGGDAAATNASARDAATASGYYLRIWKKDGGRWQVVLELLAAV